MIDSYVPGYCTHFLVLFNSMEYLKLLVELTFVLHNTFPFRGPSNETHFAISGIFALAKKDPALKLISASPRFSFIIYSLTKSWNLRVDSTCSFIKDDSIDTGRTDARCKKLADNIVAFLNDFGFHGISFYWPSAILDLHSNESNDLTGLFEVCFYKSFKGNKCRIFVTELPDTSFSSAFI